MAKHPEATRSRRNWGAGPRPRQPGQAGRRVGSQAPGEKTDSLAHGKGQRGEAGVSSGQAGAGGQALAHGDQRGARSHVPTFPRGALTSFSTPGARRGLSPNHPQPLPSLTPSYPGAKTRKACQGTGPGHLGLQAWVVLGLGVGTEALWGREGSCLRSLRTLGGVTLHLDFCGLLMAAAPPSQPTILSLGVRGSETPHSHISTLPKVPRADGGTDDGGGGS